MKKLYTIGYEAAGLADFVATLKQAGIDVLLDVRELPISRRKGFSKTALKEALAEAGIAYRHEKQLGSPKAIRHQLREDQNYQQFFREYDTHLSQRTDLLERLTREIEGNVALMCYEKDHRTCHRTSVANELARMLDLEPVHL
jgi:uncharacterized protein (DUF488 family)